MQLIKESIQERCSAFLMEKLSKMDIQTQTEVKEGRKEIHSSDFYIRKKLSGTTGIIDVILPTDSFQKGTTNIDKARLGKGQYLAVGGLMIKYAYHASTTTPDTQEYANNVFKTNDLDPDLVTAGFAIPARYVPISIQNAEIVVQAGGNLIYKGRMSEFFATSTVGFGVDANDENKKIFALPKLIPADTLISIQVLFGDNVTALSNNHFLEVSFVGAYVGDRA